MWWEKIRIFLIKINEKKNTHIFFQLNIGWHTSAVNNLRLYASSLYILLSQIVA